MIRILITEGADQTEAILEGQSWRTSSSDLRNQLNVWSTTALRSNVYEPDTERAILRYISQFLEIQVLEINIRSSKPGYVY